MTQFCMSELKMYDMVLFHQNDEQTHPLNPHALWNAIMVVWVEMVHSTPSYDPRNHVYIHTHYDILNNANQACHTSKCRETHAK